MNPEFMSATNFKHALVQRPNATKKHAQKFKIKLIFRKRSTWGLCNAFKDQNYIDHFPRA